VERLTELEGAQAKLEEEVDRLMTEWDEAKQETAELHAMCCEACKSKVKAPKPPPSIVRSLFSYFHLDKEAIVGMEDTASTAIVAGSSIGHQPPPPPKKIVPDDLSKLPRNANDDKMEGDANEKPQYTTRGDNLEADLEEMEKPQRMGDNLEGTSIQHMGGGPFRVCFLIAGLLNQLLKLQCYYPSISCQSWGYSQGPRNTYHC
jgi:hypothetical protein